MKERTLILIKPDAVRRGLVGEILQRFERRGFQLKALKLLKMDRSLAEEFYSPHKGKPFFTELVDFITSGEVVAAVIEGENAVEAVRRMIGPTRSTEAPPGTIRGDLALGLTDNAIHASDSKESFSREALLLFSGE